jgi:N-methylhydantoinase A
VDAKRNLLRATAEGSTEIRAQELRGRELSRDERRKLVAASIGASVSAVQCVLKAAGFEIWTADRVVHRLWKFLPEQRRAIRVLDLTGAIRWASNQADVRAGTVSNSERELDTFAETYTRYSDAGATIPRCYVLLAGRIIDLSGLVELKRHAGEADCVLLVDL